MSEQINSLELQVKTSADKAASSLDILVTKLDAISSILKNVGEEVAPLDKLAKAFATVSKSADKGMQNVSKAVKKNAKYEKQAFADLVKQQKKSHLAPDKLLKMPRADQNLQRHLKKQKTNLMSTIQFLMKESGHLNLHLKSADFKLLPTNTEMP